MHVNIKPLKIGDVTIDIPIIQGGMGVGISLHRLASAVSNEGALGVLSAAGIGFLHPMWEKNPRKANIIALEEEIDKVRANTEKPFGVNIMVALSDFENLLITAVKKGVDVAIMGAGLPLQVISALRKAGIKEWKTKFLPIVSSGKAARIIFSYWDKHYSVIPDGVVVEGPKAGGHLGFKREELENPPDVFDIVRDVKRVLARWEDKYAKHIPIIVAGGIWDGKDIYKAINGVGADGVQMATRFVATYECDADERFKQAYIQAKPEDIVFIKSPVGLPGRAVKNKFLEEVEAGVRKPFTCRWKCLRTCDYRKAPYCIAEALTNAAKGNLENGFAFAGANAWKVDKIVSVKELMDTLLQEYQMAISEMNI